MPKLKKKTITIFILALLVVFSIIRVLPAVKNVLTDTEVLKYGELKISDKVKCIIVRDETVYGAIHDGSISHNVAEGKLIKSGTKILNLKGGSQNSGKNSYSKYMENLGKAMELTGGKCNRRGVLSYYIDGHEGNLTPDKINDITYKKYGDEDIQPENLKRDETNKREPIFKITDNSNWYMLFWIENSDISKYELNNPVTVETDSAKIKGIISGIEKDGDRWKIAVKTNRLYKDFAKIRIIEANVITLNKKGLIIPNRCLTTKDKKVGCYVKDVSGDFIFKQVNVLATDGEFTVISGNEYADKKGKIIKTVKDYDEVLNKPKAEK